jgi:hypothetical protein
MNWKRGVMWAVVVWLLFSIVQDPAGTGAMIGSVIGAVDAFFDGIPAFVNGVMSGANA